MSFSTLFWIMCRRCSWLSEMVIQAGTEYLKSGRIYARYTLMTVEDDVVLMASSVCDLQHILDLFAAECEAAGMRIGTSKSETMVLSWKRVDCPLWVREELLPQVEEFKYHGVLFRSEGKMEREIDRTITFVINLKAL